MPKEIFKPTQKALEYFSAWDYARLRGVKENKRIDSALESDKNLFVSFAKDLAIRNLVEIPQQVLVSAYRITGTDFLTRSLKRKLAKSNQSKVAQH